MEEGNLHCILNRLLVSVLDSRFEWASFLASTLCTNRERNHPFSPLSENLLHTHTQRFIIIFKWHSNNNGTLDRRLCVLHIQTTYFVYHCACSDSYARNAVYSKSVSRSTPFTFICCTYICCSRTSSSTVWTSSREGTVTTGNKNRAGCDSHQIFVKYSLLFEMKRVCSWWQSRNGLIKNDIKNSQNSPITEHLMKHWNHHPIGR